MKKITASLVLFTAIFSVAAQEQKPPTGSIEFVSSELNSLIKKDTKVEVIAEGFQFTEGPLWVAKEKMLLFSDVPANTIYKWTEAKGKEVYIKPGGYTGTEPRGGFMGPNALFLTRGGQLLICQHGDRRIATLNAPLDAPQPNFMTLVGDYNGKKLNSPNDLVMTADGDLYFTDPSYGLERGGRDPKKEIPYQGVYKYSRLGQMSLVVDSIEQPNGIGIFPGGKTMIVANSDNRKKRWYLYDLTSTGTLANGRIFYDVSNEKGMGGCDGLKIDKAGNVFATGPGGVWIFTEAGKLIGKIKIDGLSVANCALTPDDKTIYLTATNYLLRVKMR